MGENIKCDCDEADDKEDDNAYFKNKIGYEQPCDVVTKAQIINNADPKSNRLDNDNHSLATCDKNIDHWRVPSKALNPILSSSSCETHKESNGSNVSSKCTVEDARESDVPGESDAAITDEQVKTLLSLRTSASKSLKRFAEGVADFMCSNQDIEYVEPISCCSECICLDTYAGNVIDGSSWAVEDTRKKLEREINILLSQTGDGNDLFWMDNVCVWFNDAGGEFDRKVISSGKPEELRSMLYRNRSQIINAQTRKIKRLRNQMHFNKQDEELSKTSHGLSHRHTLNYAQTRRASTSHKEVLAIFSSKYKHAETRNEDKEDSLFYDSDPETYNETRHDTISVLPSSLDLQSHRDTTIQSDESHVRGEFSWTSSSSTNEQAVKEFVNIYDNDQVSSFIEVSICCIVRILRELHNNICYLTKLRISHAPAIGTHKWETNSDLASFTLYR